MSKKKGLRSLRSTVILFVTILFLPLAVLLFVRTFFSVPPIYPEYKELIKRINSDENRDIYYKKASDMAWKICYGYFTPLGLKSYTPENMDSAEDKNSSVKVKNFDPYGVEDYFHDLFYYNRILAMEKSVWDKFNFYSENFKYTEPPPEMARFGCMFPGKEWKSDLLHDSQDILSNLKKIDEKHFFLPYEDSLSIISMRELMFVEFANVFLYLEKGDYENALDWLDTFTQVGILLKNINFYYSFFLTNHLSYVVNSVVLCPSLADTFYEHIVNSLIEAKERCRLRDFKIAYKNLLFEIENIFIIMQKNIANENFNKVIPNLVLALLYNDIARLLNKYKSDFESATWKDLEDAVTYKKGKLSIPLGKMKLLKTYGGLYMREFNVYWFGEIWQYMFVRHNYSLCALYSSILITLLEQYYAHYGEYPASLENLIEGCFSEEELIWMDKHLKIYLSPQNYCIDCNPNPSDKRFYANLYCNYNGME